MVRQCDVRAHTLPFVLLYFCIIPSRCLGSHCFVLSHDKTPCHKAFACLQQPLIGEGPEKSPQAATGERA